MRCLAVLLIAGLLRIHGLAQPLTICTEVSPPWQLLGPDGEAVGPLITDF